MVHASISHILGVLLSTIQVRRTNSEAEQAKLATCVHSKSVSGLDFSSVRCEIQNV